MPQVTDPQTANYGGVWHVSVVRLVQGGVVVAEEIEDGAFGDRKLKVCRTRWQAWVSQRTPDVRQPERLRPRRR